MAGRAGTLPEIGLEEAQVLGMDSSWIPSEDSNISDETVKLGQRYLGVRQLIDAGFNVRSYLDDPSDVLSDSFWVDREQELVAEKHQGRGLEAQASDTKLEVLWDKARLDACEKAGELLIKGESFDPLAISREAANGVGIDWDTEGMYLDSSGTRHMPGTIINFNTDTLRRLILLEQGEIT